MVVAEVVPAVVVWNQGPLADLADRPLDDARVTRASGKGGHHVIWLAHVDAEEGLRPPPERTERGSPRGAAVTRRR